MVQLVDIVVMVNLIKDHYIGILMQIKLLDLNNMMKDNVIKIGIKNQVLLAVIVIYLVDVNLDIEVQNFVKKV